MKKIEKSKKKVATISNKSREILIQLDSVIQDCNAKKGLILTTICNMAGIEKGKVSEDYSVITEE